MTDTADTTPTAEPSAAPPPAAPAPTPSAPPPGAAEGTDDVFAELNPDEKVFNRGKVEALRSEGAKYRTERNELRDRYEPFNDFVEVLADSTPDDRDAWLELMTDFRDDPVRAAPRFQAVAEAILAEAGQTAAPQVTSTEPLADPAQNGEGVDPAQMTPEAMREFIAGELSKRETERDQQAAVRQIFDKMETAGYPPQSAKGQAVLWLANNGDTKGDIDASIKAYEAELQGHADGVIAGIRDQTPGAPAPDGGLAANEPPPVPTNLDESRDKLRRRLEQQRTPGDI
jgi:hypothetical protein